MLMSGIFLSCSPLWLLRQDLSVNLKFVAWLDWLRSKPAYPPVPAPIPQNRGYRGTLPHLDFTRLPGNWTQVLYIFPALLSSLLKLPSRDMWLLCPANLHSTWCLGSDLKGHHFRCFKVKMKPSSYQTHSDLRNSCWLEHTRVAGDTMVRPSDCPPHIYTRALRNQ